LSSLVGIKPVVIMAIIKVSITYENYS